MSRTPEAVNQPPVTVSSRSLILLGACLALSGVAALVYQTAWTRQFAIVFGTSELAVATVIAAYMGGLALGAALVQRLLPRIVRPVLGFAVLELGVAGASLVVVPALLWLSSAALQAMFGGQASPPAADRLSISGFYLISAFLTLLIPTTLMGASLPLLARHVVNDDSQVGRRIGFLYAMNTAGAMAGALLAAFVLLPQLGLTATVWAGAAINGLVFLLAAAMVRRVPYTPVARGYELDQRSRAQLPAASVASPWKFPGSSWVLPLMLLAGAVAFFQEVLWTRLLSHLIGSSVYAFGVMVASFLAGIALGGAAGAWLAKGRTRAAVALASALLIAALAGAAAYLLLERLLPFTAGLMENARNVGFVTVSMNSLFAGLLLLPMTFAIGTTYPLAVRVLARNSSDASGASARVYAWNTAGAILGSLAAGFVLVPALRFEGAIQVAVIASAALGALALWILIPVNRAVAVVLTIVTILGCVLFRPAAPMALLVTSPLDVGKGRVLYYDVGRSASVVALLQDGNLALRTNGLPEAFMDTPGAIARFSGESWLSPLAVIARPDIREMLIVGLGGGGVLNGAPASVRKIDVIELEPKVVEANYAIASRRKSNPLDDPRVNIIVNDARGALRLSSHRYGAIVSQPSHPWTAGASHLYTREFLQLARDHLVSGGVFVQWMNAAFMDENLMRSLTATLLSVFPEVRVYRPDPDTLVFLASDLPLDLELRLSDTGVPLKNAPLHYASFGINNVEDLVAALVMDTEGARRLSTGAKLITDDDNRLATSSVFEEQRGMSGDVSGRLLAAQDPLQREDSFVYGALRDRLSFPYIVRRIAVFSPRDSSVADRVGRMSRWLKSGPASDYARAYYYRLMHEPQRESELLRVAIDEYPDDDDLRTEYLRGYLIELARGNADARMSEVAAGLKGLPEGVLDATRHAIRDEWLEVAQADGLLAQVRWTDAWYPEAAELRVNWRNQAPNPKFRKGFGEEGIRLIDRLSIMNPTLNLYALRVGAGAAAARMDVVVESISGYARFAGRIIQAGYPAPEAIRRDVRTFRSLLSAVAKEPRADAARIAEVRAELDLLGQ